MSEQANSNLLDASEVAGVLGKSQWETPLSIFLKKAQGIERPKSKSQALVMDVGKIMEDAALEDYRARKGGDLVFEDIERRKPLRVWDRDTGTSVIEFTPDATWKTRARHGRKGVSAELVEVRTFGSHREQDAGRGLLPEDWGIKAQIGMHAMNLHGSAARSTLMLLVSRDTGRVYEHRIEYDERKARSYISQCSRWKSRYLDRKRDIDRLTILKELARPDEDISNLAGIKADETRHLDVEPNSNDFDALIDLLGEKLQADEDGRHAKTRADLAKTGLRNYMMDAQRLSVEGVEIASFKNCAPRKPSGGDMVHDLALEIGSADFCRRLARTLAGATSAKQLELEKALLKTLPARVTNAETDIIDRNRSAPYRMLRVQHDQARDLVAEASVERAKDNEQARGDTREQAREDGDALEVAG